MVRRFGELNMKVLVANKLYSWLSPQSKQRENIPHIRYLELHYTFQRYLLCCCRQKWFRAYKSAIDTVENDLVKRFDLITFSKKLRQDSFALNLTMQNVERQLAARMSHHLRPLEHLKDSPGDIWCQNEVYLSEDRFKIAIYRRF